ncbi:MAG: SH3 domain-containing protein, partial [Paraclostridium sp.]
AQVVKAETLQNLNLRTGPSTAHSIILTIKKGSVVEVIQNDGSWAYVKYNGKTGYVSCQYIKTITSDNKPTTPEGDGQEKDMVCTGSSVNVRSGPSTFDNLIGTFKKGDNVYVIQQLSNGWSKIKFEGKVAYVSSQYLSKDVSINPPVENKDFMTCNATSLNVRSGASTAYSIVGKLKKGDKVEVINHLSNSWTEIKFNNKNAFVSSSYLIK